MEGNELRTEVYKNMNQAMKIRDFFLHVYVQESNKKNRDLETIKWLKEAKNRLLKAWSAIDEVDAILEAKGFKVQDARIANQEEVNEAHQDAIVSLEDWVLVLQKRLDKLEASCGFSN